MNHYASVTRSRICRFILSNFRPPRPCQMISTPNLFFKDKLVPPGLCLDTKKAFLIMEEPIIHSSVNGRFRVKTTEVRRVHVHSSLLVVTSNQNASNKKKNRLNIYPKPGMSHYIPCLIAE